MYAPSIRDHASESLTPAAFAGLVDAGLAKFTAYIYESCFGIPDKLSASVEVPPQTRCELHAIAQNPRIARESTRHTEAPITIQILHSGYT